MTDADFDCQALEQHSVGGARDLLDLNVAAVNGLPASGFPGRTEPRAIFPWCHAQPLLKGPVQPRDVAKASAFGDAIQCPVGRLQQSLGPIDARRLDERGW